ncbi:alpha/beta fold hydrolase [Halomonas shantousis]
MTDPETLTLAEGRIAALSWGDTDAPVWLALHGWLDNAASFSRLAPLLAEQLGLRIVAIDFAGHGLSQPRPAGGDYAMWDYVGDVIDVLDALALDRATLLAHSMGAGVACLTAATLPERVERLVLIDGLGALTTPVEDTVKQLRKGLLDHRRPASGVPRYPDLETAIAARVAGGVTPIDAATAAPLVARNVEDDGTGHVRLRTDTRLLRPSLVRFTPEQVLVILKAIEAPVLLIEGEEGIMVKRDFASQARGAVRCLCREVLPGGHHLHLETGAVSRVAQTIVGHVHRPSKAG